MEECGRQSSRLEREEHGEDWCWRIEVHDGASLENGRLFEWSGNEEKALFFIYILGVYYFAHLVTKTHR